MRRMGVRPAAVAVILLAATAAGGAGASGRHASQLRPRTLVQVRGRISGFAQDGSRIAWLWPSGYCRQLVQVEDIARATRRLLATKRGATCGGDLFWGPGQETGITLAGNRALWGFGWGSNLATHDLFVTRSLRERRDYAVGGLDFCKVVEDGDCLDAIERPLNYTAGDASTLVFLDVDDGVDSSDTTDGGIRRVVARGSKRVPGTIGAFAVAVAGRRLAFLSDTSRTAGRPCACNLDPAWSPAGDRIAFTGTPHGDRRLDAIASVAVGGSSPTVLSTTRADEYRADRGPEWSPGGSRLAFERRLACKRSCLPSLWTMNADGTGQRRLTTGEEPAWSPDGTKLAFTRRKYDLGDFLGIFVVNADGSGLRQLTGVRSHLPDWSPDGAKIAFARESGGISTINLDGSGYRRLTADGDGIGPEWSPDGNRIAFGGSGGARMIDASGANDHLIAAGGGAPAWSPDGSRLAFVGNGGIHVTDTSGGDDRVVAQGWGPVWSPDGRRLAFVKTFGEASAPAYDVFVVGSDGSSETRLTTATLEPVVPTLQLRDARTGALAARVSYPGAGRAVALSSSLAVVLVRDQGTYRVLLYGARHGDPLGSVPVPSTADDLSMAGRRVVFRTGRAIWLLDTRTRRTSRLATALPVGLSIEGRRVAWAENLRSRARIRAVFLPR